MADPVVSVWWCTPCAAWVPTKRLAIGPLCTICGSGRVRPPGPGEQVPAALAAAPPLSQQQVREQLDG